MNQVYQDRIFDSGDNIYTQLVDEVIEQRLEYNFYVHHEALYKTLTDLLGTTGELISGDTFTDDMTEETERLIGNIVMQQGMGTSTNEDGSFLTSTAKTTLDTYIAIKERIGMAEGKKEHWKLREKC